MDRVREFFRLSPAYTPLEEDAHNESDALIRDNVDDDIRDTSLEEADAEVAPFSWVNYGIFMLLGVAMLWAWNMFLAAGPYFQRRLQSSDRLLSIFQPAELSVSTVANLGSMLVLTNLQAKASYPKRIIAALLINIGVFALMALSTRVFLGMSAQAYFAFLVLAMFVSSLGTGLMQNGIFAYMSGFGRKEYAQGNMTGQAIAGVLPCIVQIVSVLSAPPVDKSESIPHESSSSAMAYFLTATGISFLTLLAFVYLLAREGREDSHGTLQGVAPTKATMSDRKRVPLFTLFRKTFWLSVSVFLTFGISMTFPVFTQQIESVQPPEKLPRYLQPATFIPLALLFWNSGDLAGRLLAAIPAIRITGKPRLVFGLALSRIVFIPLYFLCNIRGRGARVNSDLFYLFVVQLLFGISNGFIGTTCMTGAIEYVDVAEREAAGSFMALSLVAGLTAGSVLSFAVAG